MRNRASGRLILKNAPLIVGVIATAPGLRKVFRRTTRSYDVVELRADLLGLDAESLTRAIAALGRRGVPVVLTARSRKEGGRWAGTERRREALLLRLLPSAAAVDVEIRAPAFRKLAAAAHRAGTTVIGSFHDFSKTPAYAVLRAMIVRARQAGADVVKLAVTARSADDAIRLFELLKMRKTGPMCLIGMGPAGLHTRVSLPCAGSCLAYGYMDRPAAPGQLSCAELRAWLNRFLPSGLKGFASTSVN